MSSVFRNGFSVVPAVLFALTLPMFAQVNVLTYQYDNTRAGANLNESTLNKSNVNATTFGKLFAYPVDGYVYGQPLYAGSVNVPNKGIHNVVYVATEHDSVYAFDADSSAGANSAPLWQTSFLNPANGVGTVPAADTECDQIIPEIGITSTPVIDQSSGTIFVVAMTKETSGSAASYVQRLHALDMASGAEKPGSPVVIQATYPGTGEGGHTLVFNPRNYKQRPGLLLLNGTVYTAWSSHCDIGAYHGWLIGYDAQSLKQTTVYNNTPNGNEGSFWAGGAAPAVDSNGNIYLVSGNGTFDAAGNGPDLGESYIKLSSAGGLSVTDYFTPFNYDDLNANDVDTGSAGVALIGDEAGSAAHPHLMAGAGKEGRIYLLDRDSPGKLQSGSDSQIVQSLPGAIAGIFGNPAYFNQALYFCGSGDTLKAFSISDAQMSTAPTSQSTEAFGYPGCVATISANGKSNGIAWIVDPAGVLRAYDASNLASELYNSNQNAGRDALGMAVKFSVPTVVNGKVYAGTQNSLVVYGLLSAGTAAIGVSNAASGDTTALAPGSLAAIYGSGFATSAGSVAVTVGGISAPILYASPGQINIQIPFEVPPGGAHSQCHRERHSGRNKFHSYSGQRAWTVRAAGRRRRGGESERKRQISNSACRGRQRDIGILYGLGGHSTAGCYGSGRAAQPGIDCDGHGHGNHRKHCRACTVCRSGAGFRRPLSGEYCCSPIGAGCVPLAALRWRRGQQRRPSQHSVITLPAGSE